MFKNLDMYGQPIQFTYHQKSSFATSCGICVSIFVFLIIIAYIVLYIIDVAKMDYQTVVSGPENLESPPGYTFSSTANPKDFSNNGTNYLQLMFGFKSRETFEWLSEKEILRQGLNVTIYSVENGKSTREEKQKCSDPPKDLRGGFDDYALNNAFCMKNTKINLAGDRISDPKNSKYLEVIVTKTETFNDTDIDFYFIYSNYLFSEKSKNDPLIPYFDWKIYELSKTMETIVLSYFQVSKLESFTNILPKAMVGSGKVRYYSAFDKAKYSILPAEVDEDNSILHIYIMSSDIINKREIMYKNLFEILGIIGGFAQIVIIIGALIAAYPANRSLEESLVDDFYTLIDPENNDKVKEEFDVYLQNLKNPKRPEESQVVTDEEEAEEVQRKLTKRDKQRRAMNTYYFEKKKHLLEISQKIKENTANKEEKREYMSEKLLYQYYLNNIYSGMKYSCGESCINCFCCCECCKPNKLRKKNKVFKKALATLKEDTDFVSILNAVSSFDALKQSFLNENTQLNIFKSLANKSYSCVKDGKEGKIQQPIEAKNNEDVLYDDLKTYNDLYKSMIKISKDKDEADRELDKKILTELVGAEHEEEANKFFDEFGGPEEEAKEEQPKKKKEDGGKYDRRFYGSQLDKINNNFDK
ncbi:MAG: hypothetical protein MJ252_20250 [archaeon]|nr:hypothetical protein [archaeon]